VSMMLQLSTDDPQVPVDSIQIQQVLTNLVQNAFQALEDVDGFRRRLVISTAILAEGAVEVTVADSGPGFGSDDAERLFEPFVTTRAAGTGMGLAIARGIIESHCGRIWAESHGEGAAFHFILPHEAPSLKTSAVSDAFGSLARLELVGELVHG